MKNSSIVVPVILVLCLVALAFLISQALEASKNQSVPEDNGISVEPPKSSSIDSAAILESQAGNAPDAAAEDRRFSDLVPAGDRDSAVTSDGAFLIIGGTFRQESNAHTRIRNLKQAGFANTALELFDRGTFAVALVDRTDTYGAATDLARQVRSAGFEAEVYRKR
ncbi:SPOR domain-containing protein [Lewinella sp. IMCC34183]|uniref:SPOR domain-containing protein n=1 Tax=Lewinella sp. IMCC34183 TaxID=2248762 RepID=UPI000E24D390|nr:SPOR domain-containing protein [Lewinella sp. IMCC34183]